MLQRYGQALTDLAPVAPQDACIAQLQDLMVTRDRLIDGRTALKLVSQSVITPMAVTRAKSAVESLKEQITGIEEDIKILIEGSDDHAQASTILTSITGVGPITAAALIAWMPELGTIGNRQAAALPGVAPYARDSGTSSGNRHVRGAADDRAMLSTWLRCRQSTGTQTCAASPNGSAMPARPTRRVSSRSCAN